MSYYGYCINLTEQEKLEIDKKTKKFREDFSKGFAKGARFSLAVYALYSLTTSAAHAADSNVPATTPEGTGAVQPALSSEPGMEPLNDGPKGTFIGGASSICGAALQNGDFALGVACAFLLVAGAIIVNRSFNKVQHQKLLSPGSI